MATTHQKQWNTIQSMHAQNRLPSALLLVGPQHAGLSDFVWRIIQLFFCTNPQASTACGQCAECTMVSLKEHSDVIWIQSEKNTTTIKVDQIRELQHRAFIAPQRAHYKMIVIDGVEQMNTAASNALLKTLEEPSSHVHFILISEQISTILPTILSRCQLMHCDAFAPTKEHLLNLGLLYPEQSERRVLVEHAEERINELIALVKKEQHPCMLAAQWSQFELPNVLWFLYLVYSQMAYSYYLNTPIQHAADKALHELNMLLHPVKIFGQLDKINDIVRKLNHNINMNQLLALETLFFLLI